MTHHTSLAVDDALDELILVPLCGPRPDYGAASGPFLITEKHPPLWIPIWSSY